MDALQIIGGGLVGLLAAVGAGSMLLAVMNRRWKKSDDEAAVHLTNHTAEIDADKNAFNAISQRLTIVEKRMDDVNSQLMEQKVENAKLEAKLQHAEQQRDRQDEEIKNLRNRNHTLASDLQQRDAKILELTVKIGELEKRLTELTTEMHLGK